MSLPLVLIADDNAENLSLIGELLQPQHAVRVAKGGERALRLARQAPQPALILLAVMMPGMDGFEVLRQLKAQPETADIPVIFLTAPDAADDEARGLLQGAADCITKPVRPAVLLARVQAQLALRQAPAALRLHWLDSELQRLTVDHQRLQRNALQTLAQLAGQRSAQPPEAAWRLQARLHSLARQLQAMRHDAEVHDGPQLARLVQAAPWRDIGHLALPDRLLNKPGPLDATERALVQAHALRGAEAIAQAAAELLQPPPLLALAQQLARSHHERWDGSGYPDRLAGTAIPWAARLLAVADVYGALRSPRPHRPALAHDMACATVLAGRGSQFDPGVVDAFARCHVEWQAISLQPDDAGRT